MAVTGAVGLISLTGFKFTNDTMGFVIFYMVSTLSMLISITLAGVGCRKRFGGVRFSLLLGLWSIATFIAGLLGSYLIFLSLSGYSASIGTILFQITAAAMMIGAILYVIMLPFMILAFKSDFYRQRLYSYLQLKTMAESRPLKS